MIANPLTGRFFLAAILVLVLLSPLAGAAEPMLDPESLVGEHRCRGRNADGTGYEGTVAIRVKNGLVLMQWNIKDHVSYGTGLVEGMSLGVGLESGVANYTIIPQTDGKTLVGLWATEGSKTACEETIFIGNTDIEKAKLPVEKINGTYRATGDSRESVIISGGDTVKRLKMTQGDVSTTAEGILLGGVLAVITPTGLSVLQVMPEGKNATTLEGRSLDKSGKITPLSLVPAP